MSRSVGLDVGTRRIGVAVSDEQGSFAMPHSTVDARDRQAAVEAIRRIVDERDARAVVVGWPLNMDGSEGRATRRVGKLVERLEAALDEAGLHPEIVRWDERLTTTAAESMLVEADVTRRRRKDVVDQIAATHILQGYLDSTDGGRHG